MNSETLQLIESGIIGLSSGKIPLSYQSEFALASLQICQQSRRDIRIYTRDLDAALYDQPELIEVLKNLALSRREVCIRILLEDSKPARHNNHRLVSLIRRLPGSFAMRRPPEEKLGSRKSYLIADLTAVIYRNHPKEYQGHAEYSHRRQASELNKEFMELWDQSEVERELRRLHI